MGHTQSAYRVQTLDFRAPQKTPVNATLSSWHADQRLIFCMNTGSCDAHFLLVIYIWE